MKMGETDTTRHPLRAINNYEFTTIVENGIISKKTEDIYERASYANGNPFLNISGSENRSLCSHITDISQLQKCNLTVFSIYPSELLWFGATFCIIFTIIGTTGNFVSIFALLKSKKLRNATTAFIVNLCLSDLLFCSFSMPLTTLTFIDREWEGSDALCKLFALIKFSNGIVSIFTVVAITMNRYILIVHPKIYPAFFRKRYTALMIGFLWLLPLALLLLPFLNVWGTLGYDPEVADCGVMYLNGKSPRILIFVVATLFPSLLFIACYLKIYFVVSKSVRKVSRVEGHQSTPAIAQCTCATRQNPWFRKTSCACSNPAIYVHFRDRKELRLLRIVLVIFIFFVISTFPLAYVKIFHKEYDYPVLNILGYVAYFSSNVINPVIYIVMSEEYRRAYKELFCLKNSPTSISE